jgi:hypothetical protein
MSNFASFVSFLARDEKQQITLNSGDSQSITGDIPDLDDLDPRHDGVLAFKLTTTGPIKLTIKINGNNQIVGQDFGSDSKTVTRVWHEIIAGANLRPQNNKIRIETSGGTGQVVLSDFVLSYRRKDPPSHPQPH